VEYTHSYNSGDFKTKDIQNIYRGEPGEMRPRVISVEEEEMIYF
jgi:hypothetical protein